MKYRIKCKQYNYKEFKMVFIIYSTNLSKKKLCQLSMFKI